MAVCWREGRVCGVPAAAAQGKSSINISNAGPWAQTDKQGRKKREAKGKKEEEAWLVDGGHIRGWLAAGAGLRKILTLLMSDEEKDQRLLAPSLRL